MKETLLALPGDKAQFQELALAARRILFAGREVSAQTIPAPAATSA